LVCTKENKQLKWVKDIQFAILDLLCNIASLFLMWY